jgi:hypothetical protein
MQEAAMAGGLSIRPWGLCVHGLSLDDRGQAAVEFAVSNSQNAITATYSSETFQLNLGDLVVDPDQAGDALKGLVSGITVLEATTLGFAEVYLCVRALREVGASEIALLYVEPKEYLGLRRSNLLHRREFDLSDEVPGYRPIPGATLVTTSYTSQRAIFFLGYEERRLESVFEGQYVSPSNSTVVFGVPAFSPGWEMNSFANNIRVIKGNNIAGGVSFCSADSPAAAYALLTEVYDALAPEERLIIGPIGTKPNGIGAALFAGTHPDVGLLYDHPKRSAKRSSAISRWDLYTAELS